MNDDIVNRLRKIAKPEQWICLAEWETAANEAADEIERLRAIVAHVAHPHEDTAR